MRNSAAGELGTKGWPCAIHDADGARIRAKQKMGGKEEKMRAKIKNKSSGQLKIFQANETARKMIK